MTEIKEEKRLDKKRASSLEFFPAIFDNLGEKKVFLDDLIKVTDDRFVNSKKLEELTDDYQISFVSDAMFSTMIVNAKRKMFICKIF